MEIDVKKTGRVFQENKKYYLTFMDKRLVNNLLFEYKESIHIYTYGMRSGHCMFNYDFQKLGLSYRSRIKGKQGTKKEIINYCKSQWFEITDEEFINLKRTVRLKKMLRGKDEKLENLI